MDYQDINAQTIDRWIREGWEWGKPISHEVYEKAVNGEWDVYLTPTKMVQEFLLDGVFLLTNYLWIRTLIKKTRDSAIGCIKPSSAAEIFCKGRKYPGGVSKAACS